MQILSRRQGNSVSLKRLWALTMAERNLDNPNIWKKAQAYTTLVAPDNCNVSVRTEGTSQYQSTPGFFGTKRNIFISTQDRLPSMQFPILAGFHEAHHARVRDKNPQKPGNLGKILIVVNGLSKEEWRLANIPTDIVNVPPAFMDIIYGNFKEEQDAWRFSLKMCNKFNIPVGEADYNEIRRCLSSYVPQRQIASLMVEYLTLLTQDDEFAELALTSETFGRFKQSLRTTSKNMNKILERLKNVGNADYTLPEMPIDKLLLKDPQTFHAKLTTQISSVEIA